MEQIDEQEEYKGLPSEQEEELYELFCNTVNKFDLDYDTSLIYFTPGSDTFLDFLLELENKAKWFDYRQMDFILEDLTYYIKMLDDE